MVLRENIEMKALNVFILVHLNWVLVHAFKSLTIHNIIRSTKLFVNKFQAPRSDLQFTLDNQNAVNADSKREIFCNTELNGWSALIYFDVV